jgi:ABC-type transport system involved in multi-copper enzyme maturation permease subunit
MSAVIHAEWTKFRTVRGWIIGLLIAAGAAMALGLGPSMSGSCSSAASCGMTLGPTGIPVTDSFYFVRRSLDGDGTITARVTSLTGRLPRSSGNGTRAGLMPWSKAGIIIKASTRLGSAYAAMMVTGGNGVRLQYDYTGDIAGLPGRVSAASPRWLRLTRHGDTVTGYDSADGTSWSRVGAVRLPALPATVQGGLFATSPSYAVTGFSTASVYGGLSQDTAVLDHVGLAGRWAAGGRAGAWAGDHIGAPGGPAPGPATGFRQAGGVFTVTGTGDIAPVVTGANGTGVTIAQTLIGTFVALIAIVVVAAMFMTAEYRRGLIRTTFLASPRRGRVLAGKAAVIGAVTFVTGLVSSAVVVVFGQRELRANGVYVFPVTAVTEVRVIAGTAAVLALAAMLALALGTLARRSATAVTVAFLVIVLPYMFCVAAPVLPLAVQDWLLRLTPAAAFAVQATLPQYHQVTNIYAASAGYFPLAPWAGLAVLAAWTGAALALATWRLNRTDA